MHVIGHDAPSPKFIPFAIEVPDGVCYDLSHVFTLEPARTVTLVKMFLDESMSSTNCVVAQWPVWEPLRLRHRLEPMKDALRQ